VEGVTLLSFFAKLFSKKKRRSSRDSGAARQFAFFAKLSFLRKKNPSETSSTGVLPSFFQKRRSSRDSGAARQFAFFAKLSFSRKKAERGGTLRFPPLKLPSLKSLPVTVAGHWVLPLSYCACAPGASAFGTLSGRSRLLLVLRSSSQLLLRRLCSHGFARKVHSHADCALGGNRLAPVR